MAKKQNQSPVYKIDDVEYDVNKDFNDEQKQIFLHLRNIDEKISSNNFNQQQLGVSKNGFIALMRESLKKSKEKNKC